MRKTIFTAAIAAVATIALLIPAGAATAGGVEKEKHGQCTPKGRWELSLDKEAGRIEVDFEVTARPAGQRWKVVMRHDGVKFFDGTRVTRLDDDPRPDFEIERSVKDTVGWDRFRVKATNLATGAHCVAKLKI
jgi:hypothetical protein